MLGEVAHRDAKFLVSNYKHRHTPLLRSAKYLPSAVYREECLVTPTSPCEIRYTSAIRILQGRE